MKTLREIIIDAEKNKTAIGHFNVSDLIGLKAIFETAKNLQLPIIIGVSEGEREFIGTKQIAALVKSLREEYGYPTPNKSLRDYTGQVFLNADHTRSLEKIKEAVEAGFDAVLFDGGKLPFEENIKKTKEVVEFVKSVNPNVLVEGELGYIGASSTILKEIPQGAAIKKEDLTKPEEAARFVKETGVDLLAPAVGNIHGILMRTDADLTRTNADNNQHQSAQISINQRQEMIGNPPLNIQRIKEIKEAVRIPLVLHGGSGIKDNNFTEAIDAGISIIHINTELRLAWRKGIEKAFKENPEEIIPYKVLPRAVKEIKSVVEQRLKLFNKML